MSHLEYTRKLTAKQMIEYIARDYIELSHDKVLWQRDDWRKMCQDWLQNNSEEEENKMTDAFDLEQQIMECWRVVDDISTLNEGLLDYEINADKVSNTLIGLKELYNLKFEKLFRTYEALIEEKKLTY
jgi:hypothetical protein